MSNNARGIGNYAFSMYCFLDSSGYPMGVDSTPDTVANGSDTGGYVYDKNISLGGIPKSHETIQFKGGGRVWSKNIIGNSDIGNMPLSMSGEDPTLEAYFNNTVVDTTTNSNVVGWSHNLGNSEFPNFMSVHYSRYHDVNGDTKWRSYFVLNHGVIQPSGASLSDSGGTNPNPVSYEFVPTPHNRLPWGQLFSANSNISVANDRDYEWIIEADYPYGIHTYVDDNSGTSDAFTLQYTPAQTDDGYFFIYNNGVDDSSNVAVASDGDVSLTAANSAGDKLVIVYPMIYPLVATA